MRISKHTLLLALTFISCSAFAETNVAALKGNMVPESFRKKMSEEGLNALEEARARILNDDAIQDVTWQDPKADFSGQFQKTGRYTLKDSGVRCREYIHVLSNRKGEPVPSESTGRPFKIRNTVCFEGNAWAKYTGDTSLLIAESADTKPAASGQTGPEHRRKYPKMVGPVALGQILDGVKLFRKNIEDQVNPEIADLVREQMYDWFKNLVSEMKTHDKTLAIDQLAILLAEIKTDDAKIKSVEVLKPRLDERVGDKKAVTSLISSNSKKKQMERLLR